MTVHHLSLKGFILPFIVSGEKDLEIRVADEKRQKIAVGDTIIFSGQCHRTVKAIRCYRSFAVMLQGEDRQRIMPGWSAGEIMAGLRSIYSLERERLGVLVFELEAVTLS